MCFACVSLDLFKLVPGHTAALLYWGEPHILVSGFLKTNRIPTPPPPKEKKNILENQYINFGSNWVLFVMECKPVLGCPAVSVMVVASRGPEGVAGL